MNSMKTVTLTCDNYYSAEANREYFSVSQYKDFLKCPAMAMAKVAGKYEPDFGRALLLGVSFLRWVRRGLQYFYRGCRAVVR